MPAGLLLLVLGLASAPLGAQTPGAERLYGRVTTTSGEVHEGYLRWDLDEASPFDILDGSKRMPDAYREEARTRAEWKGRDGVRSLDFMGVRVSWDEDVAEDWPSTAESGIRFAHIQRLVPLSGDTALIELSDGQRVELHGGGTDLGEDMRGLEVLGADGRAVVFGWTEIAALELLAPRLTASSAESRIYGSARDRSGRVFVGFLTFGSGKTLMRDSLRGWIGSERRSLPVSSITTFRMLASEAVLVSLVSGETLEFDGRGDVGPRAEAIEISDPHLGRARISWRDLASVEIHREGNPVSVGGPLDPGPITGVVTTRADESFAGMIRWDNDEASRWELLDGRSRNVVLDVELGSIARITRRSSRRADVVLRDGRSFTMERSNDVDSENKGVFVHLDDGRIIAVDWSALQEVRFEGPRS